MTAKLFRNSMAVAVSVMALSIILFMGVLYQYFSDQMMEALGTETWLVARGVEMEAYSVEDQGRGVCFHVYCYNVQPGVEIDYATGENWEA